MIILKFETTRDFINWLVEEETAHLRDALRNYEVDDIERWL